MKSKQARSVTKKTILFVVITLLAITGCKKGTTNQTNSTNGTSNTPSSQIGKLVIAEGGLNARENPDLTAKVVFLLPNYYSIETYEEVGEEMEVKDKKGKWTKIDYEGKTGYVFGGYLTNARLNNSGHNEANTYYFNFYSTPAQGNTELTDCLSNYMQAGCLVVVYKASNNKPINAFMDTVADGWIDKDHLATSWSIGDAGYGGDGIKSINIHTKDSTDIYRRDSQMKIGEEDGSEESDKLCLKEFCFDLKKNPNALTQIKSTRGLKFFESGQYQGSASEYSTEIQLGPNDTIVFFPGKNIVMRK